jgi:hypothetical protein
MVQNLGSVVAYLSHTDHADTPIDPTEIKRADPGGYIIETTRLSACSGVRDFE